MIKETVTSALKESLVKVTGKMGSGFFYSDSRKRKTAVGVKVCRELYTQPVIQLIVEDMELKGFKLAYTRHNISKDYKLNHSVIGTRFCFFKKGI